MPTDAELLRQYVQEGSEAAFAELVRRYLGLVYSAAVRQAGGNGSLAEDATQTVFIILARQGLSLVGHESLVGWLHTCTRHTTLRALRDVRRRQARELKAAAMEINDTPKTSWDEVRPLLDEAVGQLGAADRQAVLLRFFQGRSHREVGEALGVTEDAARVRVDRALEKLRCQFARRGIVATGALLGETILANAAEAEPAGLARRMNTASAAGTVTLGWSAWMLRLILMSTEKKILVATALVLLASLFTFVLPQWVGASTRDNPSSAGEVINPAKMAQSGKAVVEAPRAVSAPPSSSAAEAATAASVATSQPLAVVPLPVPPPPDVMRGAGARRDGSNDYDNFAARMKLTAEQESELLRILNEQGGRISALHDAVRNKLGDEKFMEILSEVGKNPLLNEVNVIQDSWTYSQIFQSQANERYGITDQVKAINEATAVKLRQLLGGEENFKAYQIYNSQMGVRTWVTVNYGHALQSAGVDSLTVDQQEALVDIIAKSIKQDDSPAQLGHIDEVVDKAKTVLTSQQLHILQKNPRGQGLSYARLHNAP